MKKIKIFFICTLMISAFLTGIPTNESKYATEIQPSIEWMKTYGGAEDDVCVHMQKTTDGGFILVGQTRSFGTQTGDVWLIKTDTNGNEIWSKTYGDTYQNVGNCVQETDDGGYIVAGWTKPLLLYEGYWIKTDKNGNKQNEITEPGSMHWDSISCIQQTNDGSFISVGKSESNDPSGQVWLVKKGTNLLTYWTRFFGSDSEGTWVECTAEGGYIIAGRTHSPTHSYQMLLSKTDEDGYEEWFKTFGGTDLENAFCVKQTSDGGYVVVGLTRSYAQFEADVYVVKTDALGNKIWEKTIDSQANEWGNSITETDDGGYFIVGTRDAGGLKDLLAIKLDKNHDIEWANIYGEEQPADYGCCGYQTSDRGYIIAGYSNSYGAGNSDFWLFKLESENNPPDTPNTPIGPSIGSIGSSYSYSTSGSDPDGDQVKYGFDWGDGTPVSWTNYVNSGNTASKSHTWSTSGTYQVKAKSQDSYGFESGWSPSQTVTISIVNNPPNKPSTPTGPSSGKSGESYSYSSSAIDPDGDQVYLMFDWGDGSTPTWKGPFSSGTTDIESHVWSTKGSYTLKVKAKDTSDAESVWSDPLPITMPYNHNPLLHLFEWLIQRFPNVFFVLEQIFGK